MVTPKRVWVNLATLAILVAGSNQPSFSQKASSQVDKNVTYMFDGRMINGVQAQALDLYNQSFKDSEAGNWEAANAKLEQALALDDGLYQAHSNRAITLSRMGRLDEALAEANKAKQMAPDKPEPITAVAAVNQAMGNLDEAAKLYQQFTTRFPKHPMASYARSLITQLQVEIQKQKIIAKAQEKTNGANDYFGHATFDAITKWPQNKFPLAVYMPTDAEAKNVPGYKPEYGAALRQGFEDWQSKASQGISFNFVSNPDASDIECYFTNDPTKVSRPAEGGEANVMFDSHGIRHAKITILTRLPDIARELPVNFIQTASLHEIGHSLGILGHSPDSHDVMFCSIPAADQPHLLTERDANTLNHLYSPDVAVVQHMNDPIGPADKNSINTEGLKLASAQKFSLAAEKFEAALKIDPNYEPARRNLSVCVNNLAIEAVNNGHPADAIAQFKRALELEGPKGDKAKRASILRNLSLVYQKLNRPNDAQLARAEAAKLTSDGQVTSLKSH